MALQMLENAAQHSVGSQSRIQANVYRTGAGALERRRRKTRDKLIWHVTAGITSRACAPEDPWRRYRSRWSAGAAITKTKAQLRRRILAGR